METTKTQILNHQQIEQKINRIAYQIYENNSEEKELIIAGIIGNGYTLAQKIEKKIKEISPLKIKLATILLNKQELLTSSVECDLPEEELFDKIVIVVDDVLDSGRTMIYGLKYFLDFNVKKIRTVVLVDRSHRSFPIRADYVGLSLTTTLQEQIRVVFEENNNQALLQ